MIFYTICRRKFFSPYVKNVSLVVNILHALQRLKIIVKIVNNSDFPSYERLLLRLFVQNECTTENKFLMSLYSKKEITELLLFDAKNGKFCR
jgi:hypothetical protein